MLNLVQLFVTQRPKIKKIQSAKNELNISRNVSGNILVLVRLKVKEELTPADYLKERKQMPTNNKVGKLAKNIGSNKSKNLLSYVHGRQNASFPTLLFVGMCYLSFK